MKLEVWGASKRDVRCPQCDQLKAHLDKQYAVYAFMDVDDYPNARQELGIRSIPVAILRNNDGSEAGRVVGFSPDKKLAVDAFLEQL